MKEQVIEFNSNDWRARFIIQSKALFHKDDFFNLDDCVIKIVTSKQKEVFLVDMYISKDKFDDYSALFDYSLDRINEFISQLSAITFSVATVLKFVSICPISVNKGEEFPLILSEIDFDRSNTIVYSSDLVDISSQKDSNIKYSLLYMIRQAMNSITFDQKFLYYFAALDAIATIETTEKVKNICQNCGFESDGILATSMYLKELFLHYNVKTTDYNKIRKLRGKIAHGGGKRNQKFYKELRSYLPILESISFAEVTKKIGIVPKLKSNITFGTLIWHIQGKKMSNRIWFIPPAFNIVSQKLKVEFKFSSLENASSRPFHSENLEGSFGIDNPSRPNINKDVWPY